MLDQPNVIEMQETSPGAFAQVASETPPAGDIPHELSVYFVLNGGKVGPTTDNSTDELAVDNPATFIKISMNFTSEKPGEIHDLLRSCVGVIVQTKQGDSKPQVTALAVAAEEAR